MQIEEKELNMQNLHCTCYLIQEALEKNISEFRDFLKLTVTDFYLNSECTVCVCYSNPHTQPTQAKTEYFQNSVERASLEPCTENANRRKGIKYAKFTLYMLSNTRGSREKYL